MTAPSDKWVASAYEVRKFHINSLVLYAILSFVAVSYSTLSSYVVAPERSVWGMYTKMFNFCFEVCIN